MGWKAVDPLENPSSPESYEDATEQADNLRGPMIEPEDTLSYVADRLMDIEAAIYRGPWALAQARKAEAVAQDRHDLAKARALATVPVEENGRKLTAADREAKVFIATSGERQALQVATAAFEYAKDVNRALDREKDSLQTRSANLRNQAQLAGYGRA